MVGRFDYADLSASFRPFSASEVAALRRRPLRTEAEKVRDRLLREMAKAS
jgi:hypothetical protein